MLAVPKHVPAELQFSISLFIYSLSLFTHLQDSFNHICQYSHLSFCAMFLRTTVIIITFWSDLWAVIKHKSSTSTLIASAYSWHDILVAFHSAMRLSHERGKKAGFESVNNCYCREDPFKKIMWSFCEGGMEMHFAHTFSLCPLVTLPKILSALYIERGRFIFLFDLFSQWHWVALWRAKRNIDFQVLKF